MTLLNCLLSAWYGMPFVSPNNLLVSTINGTGAVIEIVYVLVFLLFAPKKEKSKILGLFILVLSLFDIVVLVSFLALHGNSRKLFCGIAATVFSIIMYGSPLTIIRLVIKTKSVEFMPFFLSLFVFLCGTSWFIFGLLGKDPFVAIPNGFRVLIRGDAADPLRHIPEQQRRGQRRAGGDGEAGEQNPATEATGRCTSAA